MVQVHPSFDTQTKTWYLDSGEEALSLRELKKQLIPYTRIEGYYPNGYTHKIAYREPAAHPQKQQIQNPPIARVAQGVETQQNDEIKPTIPRPTIKRSYPDANSKWPRKYNHDAILNLWFAGLDGPTIASELGIERWQAVVNIVWMERQNGDPRAVERNPRVKRRLARIPIAG